MIIGGIIRLNKRSIFAFVAFILCIIYFYSIIRNDNKLEHKLNQRVINLYDLFEVCKNAAENGGVEVESAKDSRIIKLKGHTKEGVPDSVTTADINSHCVMLGTIKYSFPHVKVISEEAKADCDDEKNLPIYKRSTYSKNKISDLIDEYVNVDDVTVWIDPLDATKEYTEKKYEYVTTMVCVAVKGEPIIGIIHNPFSKSTSWAWVGKTTSEDLIPHKNIINNEIKKIIISISHTGEIDEVLKKTLDNFEVINAAGAGYKALQVATGNADAYLHKTTIKKWDICAGNAIIDALGGRMTTKDGNRIDYSAITNVKNEEGLIATLKDHKYFVGKLDLPNRMNNNL